MALIPGYHASEWDREVQRQHALPSLQLANSMIRRRINIPYFADAREHMPGVLAYYARGICVLKGWNVTENFHVVASLELVAPNLPDACFATEQSARTAFIYGVLTAICQLGYESVYSQGFVGIRPTSNTQAVNDMLLRINLENVPVSVEAFIRTLVNQPEGPLGGGIYNVHLTQAVALIADALVSHGTNRAKALGCNYYTLMYVSMAKRGNITAAKINAINQSVSQETNLNCDITAEGVQRMSMILSRFVNETNAQVIMTGMATAIQGYSLRLKLTVQQAAKSGMTAYWAIMEAVRIFVDFPWQEASRYIRDDFVHFQAARALVGDNEYYGFAQDLGEAKHTKYLSLSWLAVKLLIAHRASEYGSLSNYRGIPANPNHRAELQALLDGYTPPANPEPWEGMDAFLAGIRN